MLIINSWKDLENWVVEHVDPSTNSQVCLDLAECIRYTNDCPCWGQDWSAYLASLPENLLDLLPDVE